MLEIDEQSSLLPSSPAARSRATEDEQRHARTKRTFAVGLVVVMALGAFIGVAKTTSLLPTATSANAADESTDMAGKSNKHKKHHKHKSTSNSTDSTDSSTDSSENETSVKVAWQRTLSLDFMATNDYITADAPAAVNYPWVETHKLVEPYRTATFTATITDADAADAREYEWTFSGPNVDTTTASGQTVEVTFYSVGEVDVALTATAASGARETKNATVRSRYVRRELRTLSDVDRVAFFDTAQLVYNTSCDEGKATWGGDFECIDTFIRLHNTLAGDPSCDHMHDGYGFLTSHAALSSWFERVLQVVNPLVSLPYWDYTIEGQRVTDSGDENVWRQSEVWDDDWFGPANTADTGHIVATGRWAYTPVKRGPAASNFSKYTNAYGLMRAPWNQNSIPFVTRSNTTYGFTLADLPDCKSHYDQMKYDTFSDFAKLVQYNPHGTTHLAIGGVFNADWKNVLKEHNYDLREAPEWVLIGFAKQKNMYRKGWLSCPSTCAPDTPSFECKCVCADIESYLTDDAALLGVMDVVFAGEDKLFWNQKGNSVEHVILKLLCNDFDKMAPSMGDSLESASPADITFWPTHPTVDRLLHHRRLLGMDDSSWPSSASWSVQGFAVDYCWLHDADDVGPWPTMFASSEGPYTNSDLWELMSPESPSLAYVYDTFEWPHCEAAGYPLDLKQSDDVEEEDDKVYNTNEDHPASGELTNGDTGGAPVDAPPSDASSSPPPPAASSRMSREA